jgi:hypothetical protein
MRFTITHDDAVKHLRWLLNLKRYPRGIIGTHTDDGQIPVAQHEWRPDHAPTADEVLGRGGSVTPSTQRRKAPGT